MLLRLLTLPLTGIALLVGGFLYDVLFAGLPYQDPTPAMQKDWDLHATIAAAIMLAGIGVLVLGLASAPVIWMQHKRQQRLDRLGPFRDDQTKR